MATIIPARDETDELPLLYDGQHLSQAEFHRLYDACQTDHKFELIEGVVYMAAAYRRPHSRLGHLVGGLLLMYETCTPGVEGLPGATTILDDQNEPEPDLQLRIRSEFGGRGGITADQYVTGAPELVIEVSHSSLKLDMNQKLHMYRRLGVLEYLVVDVQAASLHWFVWPEGERSVHSDGIWRSSTFPGLWINAAALFQEQVLELQATLNEGLKQPEHAQFVTTLHNAQQK